MKITTFVLSRWTHKISVSGLVFLLALGLNMFLPETVQAQLGVAPTAVPAGGCAIDGNLLSRIPATAPFSPNNGDFLPNEGAPGSGGYVFTLAGAPVDTATSFHPVDGYDAADASIFTGGSKLNNNPNSWKWKTGKPPAKDDINNALFFFSSDSLGNLWFVGSGDRNKTNGNTYLDFELLQNPLYKNAGGTFTSLGPDGGRTIGDLVITVIYVVGGSTPQLVIHRWDSTGPGTFGYTVVTPAAGTTFLAVNTDSTIVVPYGAFGASTYSKYAFTEVACNLNDLIPGSVNCLDIQTVIIKTKASQAINAELKDFINPIQLSVSSAPEVSVNSPSICYGDSAILTATVISGTGPFTYLWSTGETTQSITVSPDTTTQYSVVVTGGNGCPSAPAISTVTVLPLPVVSITGNDSICPGDTATLTANVQSGTGPFTYLWSTGDTTQSVAVAPDTTTLYSVVVTGGNGCSSEPATFTVTVVPAPVVVITGNDSICIGDTTLLTATVQSGTGPFTYLWSTGDTTQSVAVAPDTTTLYSVVATGGFGCPSEPAFLTVTVFPIPLCSITGPDTICPAGSGQFSAPDTLGTYAWTVTGNGTIQGSSSGPVVVVQGSGACDSAFTLTLVVTNAGGCSSSCTKTVALVDTLSPVITDVPLPLSVSCASEVPSATSDTVTVTDNCAGDVALLVSDSITGQTCANQFTLIRTWTATDLCGNTATASQTITVFDSLSPLLIGVPADTGVCCADSIPAPALVTATDNCDTLVVVVMTEAVSDSTGPNMFTLTRTWTATDVCGNSATDSQVITVNDTLFDHGYPNGLNAPDGNVILKFTVAPNPFIGSTNIQFRLSEDAGATVELYNSMGRKVKSVFDGTVTAGTDVMLNMTLDMSMQQGIYLLVIRTNHGIETKRIILIK